MIAVLKCIMVNKEGSVLIVFSAGTLLGIDLMNTE